MAWPITADDVQEELRWKDDQLGDVDLAHEAEAAMSRIETVVGQRRGQTRVVRVRAPGAPVVLPGVVVSITSVVSSGTTLDPGSYDFDDEDGILYGPVPVGAVVTCVAPSTVPPEIEEAALVLAATWVRQRKVGPARRGSDSDQDIAVGFAMPRRVSELIRPYALTGFA